MRFKDVFSIIGPAMVGPSSSHTAGAIRLGRAARQLLDAIPRTINIIFYGSLLKHIKVMEPLMLVPLFTLSVY